MPQSPDHSSTEPDPSCSDQLAMATEREKFPAHFRFSQRYGYEPLPEPMRLEYISGDLRREIFDATYLFLGGMSTDCGWIIGLDSECIKIILGEVQKIPQIKVKLYFDHVVESFENVILRGNLSDFLDCLEIIINRSLEFLEGIIRLKGELLIFTPESSLFDAVSKLRNEIARLFDKHAAAYQLDISKSPYWFLPRVSKEQGEATQQAIETLHEGGMDSAAQHLRQAAEHMKNKQYPDSVADSIHAVESVAGEVDPKSRKTLGKALDSLEEEGILQNSFFKEALKKLHGYANQPGIRHGQHEGSTVNVGLDDAILMYGACASFAAYLAQKRQGKQKTIDAVGTPQADPQHAPNSYAPEGFQSVDQEAVQELPVEEEDDFPF